MEIIIRAIGKERSNLYLDAKDEYLKRTRWGIKIKEIESVKNLPTELIKEKEGKLLLAEIPSGSLIISLDERGKQLNSELFAKWIEGKLSKCGRIYFLIGGAFGLSQEVKDKSSYTISFSEMTLPHKLVRIILLEQLYRAYTIINNHPYHKA